MRENWAKMISSVAVQQHALADWLGLRELLAVLSLTFSNNSNNSNKSTKKQNTNNNTNTNKNKNTNQNKNTNTNNNNNKNNNKTRQQHHGWIGHRIGLHAPISTR